MSEGIKRMLAERAKIETERAVADKGIVRWQRLVEETMAFIERAAPFMDEGFAGDGWKPSEKLKILYWVASTAPRAEAAKDALIFIHEMLVKARNLWVAGLHPDPWADAPGQR